MIKMKVYKDSIVFEQRKLVMDLYKELFPLGAKYIKQRGGSYETAKDLFQDSLIIYFERIKSQNTEILNHKAYIMGILRHLWFQHYKDVRRWDLYEDFDVEIASSVDEYLKPAPKKLLRHLEKVGKKCMNLLTAFYYQKKSLSEIAEEFEFSNTRSATVQKYKCIEKVRNNIKEKKLSYADFLE